MNRKVNFVLNIALIASMLLAIGVTSPVAAQDGPPPRDLSDRVMEIPEGSGFEDLTDTTAEDKIEPSLADKLTGEDSLPIYIVSYGKINVDKFVTDKLERPAVAFELNYTFGSATPDGIRAIAKISNVIGVFDNSLPTDPAPIDVDRGAEPSQEEAIQRLLALRDQDLGDYSNVDAGTSGWFDVLDGHQSAEAWKKGFDGEGVVVAVIDDGVDFAHPDLQGTYAVVTDPTSPYNGWPMAFSQASTQYFALDILTGTSYILNQAAASRWAVTEKVVAMAGAPGGTANVTFQPKGASAELTFTVPTNSISGSGKMTSFPDANLTDALGQKAAVLVLDEHTTGVYDTVYIDLDGDQNFLDEKPITKASPEGWHDLDGDHLADISGGLLAWISDGLNTPPVVKWLWEISCGDEVGTQLACPASGDLLIFTGAMAADYSHGTQCGSAVAGQGVVSGGASAQPFAEGGMVQGAGKNAEIWDMGTFYQSFADEDHYLVAALGYDGIPMSGDEAQITTNSYGAFTRMWGAWDYTGRLITALNYSLAPSTAYLFSGGNEGPGYGPQEGSGSSTIIKVGTSTQFGSTNWDSISTADQIVYGDPSSFGAKGPNRDGSAGLDILANGGRGAGDEALNHFGFNGAESWDTWGGTSRSSPVAAGNLALIYDAFNTRYGRWPTFMEARAILKSGATDSVSSPFFQGAGVINADRSTDLASGAYGVIAYPDEWMVGDWQGTRYSDFANVAVPGQSYTQEYTLQNPSGYPINVNLADSYMQKIGTKDYTFTTSNYLQESGYNFNSPDYLWQLPTTDVPANAEVMIVKYVHSYDSFDPEYDFSGSPNSSWRFMVYNWTDKNKDGKLWTDANANGTVNHVDSSVVTNDGLVVPDFTRSEMQKDEYVRMDYQFGGLSVPIIIRDPLDRMADGYFFGAQHRRVSATVPQTEIKVSVEFYARADWPWLSLSNTALTIAPESVAAFTATAAIPANAAPGIYEGVIYMSDPGDKFHEAHETALPITVNVIADLPNNGSVTLGGTPMADTMYQNGWTNGYFNYYGGGWTGAGDWRHYFLNIDSTDAANDNLLVKTSWENVPTDINTFVLGPTLDCASNGVGTCAGWEPGIAQPDTYLYGPYTLQPIAQTSPFMAGAIYPFETSTGEAEDWLKVPLDQAGLHEVALHNVLYAGEDIYESFQVDVGTIAYEGTMALADGTLTINPIDIKAFDDEGMAELTFTPSIALPDFAVTLAGGLTKDSYGPFDTGPIINNGGAYSAWDSDNTIVSFTVEPTDATLLYTRLDVTGTEDVDMFLVRDNGNGTFGTGDTVVGSSGNSTGTDEEISLSNPPAGMYFLSLAGYSVTEGVHLNWYYDLTHPAPIPAEPIDVINAPVTVQKDSPFDPIGSATIVHSFTTTNRTAAMHAEVTGIPAGTDVDLYVLDDLGILAESAQLGNVNERIDILAPAGEYRMTAGKQYTVVVVGTTVPTPVDVQLHIWSDQLNIWLEDANASGATVHAGPIAANAPIKVNLRYSKIGMPVGTLLGATLIAGPSTLPDAFYEPVNIVRQDAAKAGHVDFVVTSPRGNSLLNFDFDSTTPGVQPNPFGYPEPPSQPLVAPGETLTAVLTVYNDGLFPQDFIAEFYFNDAAFNFTGFVGTAPDVYDNYIDGTWEILDVETPVLGAGESVTYTFTLLPVTINPGVLYRGWLDLYTPATPAWDGLPYSSGAYTQMYYRGFSLGSTTNPGATQLSSKTGSPTAVERGDAIQYSIKLVNPSSVDTLLYMVDPLPAQVEFVSATNGAVYDLATHTVTWNGTVPGNVNVVTEILINVTVAATAAEGISFSNAARVGRTVDALDWIESTSTFVIDPTQPEIWIDKSVDKLIAGPGETVTFNIVVTNTGNEDAVDVQVVDIIPAYLDVDELSLPVGVTVVDDVLTWTGTVTAGGTASFAYSASVKADAPITYNLINGASLYDSDDNLWDFSSALTEVYKLFNVFLPLLLR